MNSKAQCPPNIDFENGTFGGWTCHYGSVAAINQQNVISLVPAAGPISDQHTMYSRAIDGGAVDYYGNFPVLCPNGSSHSVKLGNTTGGAQAEGLSYEFTIPADRNEYSLIYHYAVVFQDPSHEEYQQPRLVLEVSDMTSNELLECSSFTFFPNGSPLPGFFNSPKSDSIPVWCKDWSAVSINLNGRAGRTIRLFFKTADCTFRRHFGYAYIDVNSECSSQFVGATYCPDDTAVTVTAPYGYQNYTWFNSTFTQTLGSTQSLYFHPPPPPGTTIAVEIVPYDGYGCLDTLYANLIDTLKLKANAGADKVSCNEASVQLGVNPMQNVIYSWSPTTTLSDPNIANPTASPDADTEYELSIRSLGGGCRNKDSVIVKASFVDSTLGIDGKALFCSNTGDSAVLFVAPTDDIKWFFNGAQISGASLPRYRVPKSGSYYAVVTNEDGCTETTRSQTVSIEVPRPGIYYPLQYAVEHYPLQLNARTFGATILWNPSVFLDNPERVNPIFLSPTETEQLYNIKITTAAGCITIDRQVVKTVKKVEVFVPTAFTPNNNGLNDFFKPVTYGIKQMEFFSVYNRWGQLVYQMQAGQEGWNGTLKSTPQPTGVYVWMYRGLGLDNKVYFRKGTVTLIR